MQYMSILSRFFYAGSCRMRLFQQPARGACALAFKADLKHFARLWMVLQSMRLIRRRRIDATCVGSVIYLLNEASVDAGQQQSCQEPGEFGADRLRWWESGPLFRSFSSNSDDYSPQTIEKLASLSSLARRDRPNPPGS
jgi:hypothetical protein